MSTDRRPGRRHWLEQTGHTEVEGDGGRSQSVSVSVQKAWRGTPALGQRPGKEDRA